MDRMVGTLVVGGGVVGKACALSLRRAGESVTLLDPQALPRPASYGNAGHIATEQVAPLASPAALASAFRRLFGLGGALDFRLTDIGAWGPWASRFVAAATADRAAAGQRALGGLLQDALPAWRRLAQSLGRPDLLIERGHIVVWESAASARAGRAAWEAADIGQARIGPLAEPNRARLQQLIQPTIADGLGGNLEPGAVTFDYVERHVHDIVAVDEASIVAAVGDLAGDDHLVAEGAAAVGPAAVATGRIGEVAGKRVGIVLTGANIDRARLARCLAD